LPGAALKNASLSTPEEPPSGGLAFTNYDLPLPGEDGIYGTEDDLILRDGVVMKASEVKEATPRANAPTRASKH
jgi:hypothetical protein